MVCHPAGLGCSSTYIARAALELTRFRGVCLAETARGDLMPKTHPPYPAEYRRRLVEQVRAGRSLKQLAREFEPSVESIRQWVKQAQLDIGERSDGLTSSEREELTRLRRENRVLREEREIYQKPRPGSPRRPAQCRHGVPIRECESGHARDCHDVPGVWGLHQRLLCVADTAALGAGAHRCGT